MNLVFLKNYFVAFRSIPLVVAALALNGIGIGGEQVAGIMDSLHEAV